jgi:hypothetical protein
LRIDGFARVIVTLPGLATSAFLLKASDAGATAFSLSVVAPNATATAVRATAAAIEMSRTRFTGLLSAGGPV